MLRAEAGFMENESLIGFVPKDGWLAVDDRDGGSWMWRWHNQESLAADDSAELCDDEWWQRCVKKWWQESERWRTERSRHDWHSTPTLEPSEFGERRIQFDGDQAELVPLAYQFVCNTAQQRRCRSVYSSCTTRKKQFEQKTNKSMTWKRNEWTHLVTTPLSEK